MLYIEREAIKLILQSDIWNDFRVNNPIISVGFILLLISAISIIIAVKFGKLTISVVLGLFSMCLIYFGYYGVLTSQWIAGGFIGIAITLTMIGGSIKRESN